MKEYNVSLHKESYKIFVSDSIANISKHWTGIGVKTLYADLDYLQLLENNGPLGYRYYYATIIKGNDVVGCLYFQSKRVKLSKDFRVHAHKDSFLEKFKVNFLKSFFKLINQNILICGNVLLTGEYAFGSHNDLELDSNIIDACFEKVILYIKDVDSTRIQSILCKDFYIEGEHKLQTFKGTGFYEFKVQPAMVFPFDSSWNEFSDYLAAVKSKYRVKFKKVLKKGEKLEFRQLSVDEARDYNDKMYNLYKSTADRATFSLFTLDKNYFVKLKETLKEKLELTGIFENGNLVGFFTFVKDGSHGDAHFLGYEVSLNSKFQIYFNILLKLIEAGINNKLEYLNLSRTALEIKSSVGAEPHGMYVYLKHQNSLVNSVLPWILKRIVPKNSWEKRSPFK